MELFETWEQDPEFASLGLSEKARIYLNYFDKELADDEFRKLPQDQQRRIWINFLHAQQVDLGQVAEAPEPGILEKYVTQPAREVKKLGKRALEAIPVPAVVPPKEVAAPKAQVAQLAKDIRAEAVEPYGAETFRPEIPSAPLPKLPVTPPKALERVAELPAGMLPPKEGRGILTMTAEEEMRFAKDHPNLYGAWGALTSLLPYGQYMSPTTRKELMEKPTPWGGLEILGEALGWGLGITVMPELMTLAGRQLMRIPWFARNANKPIMQFLRDSQWFRRITNKERGLVVQSLEEMEKAGLSEAQILKTLRKRGGPEFEKYYNKVLKEHGGIPEEAPKLPVTRRKVPTVAAEREPLYRAIRPIEERGMPVVEYKRPIKAPIAEISKMTEAEITAEIDKIVAIAHKRMEKADLALRGLKPTETEWMTTEEFERLESLKQALPRPISAVEAKERVAKKRAARLAKKLEPPKLPPTEPYRLSEEARRELERITEYHRPTAPRVKKAEKEPWEMDATEFHHWYKKQPGVSPMDTVRYEKEDHIRYIQKALSEGKPVPAEVLKDYPELKPTTKPYEGLTPGSKEWMRIWKERPELQKEMLAYKERIAPEKKARPVVPPKRPPVTAKEARAKAAQAEKEYWQTRLKKAAKEKYLVPWIAKSGGVKPDILTGEIKDIIYTVDAKGRKRLVRKLTPGFLSKKGRSPDVLVRDAREAGFAVRDEDHLFELIEKDLRSAQKNDIKNRVTRVSTEPTTEEEFIEGIVEHERQKLRDQGYTEEQITRAEKSLDDEITAQTYPKPEETYQDLRKYFEEVSKEKPLAFRPFKAIKEKKLKKRLAKEIKRHEERAAYVPKKGTSLYRAKSLEDAGGYATLKHRIIEMPEIVELATELMGGRYPSVMRKLARSLALGRFRTVAPKAKIELRAKIFEDADEAAAILAHEVGHLIDWLPEKTIARGNILGRIASLKKYMKHTLPKSPRGEFGPLTDTDRQRLRRIAQKMIKEEYADKWIDEEIRKELPIKPADVLAIWNRTEQAKLINPELHDYVATLTTPEKKSIVKDAIQGQVRMDLQKFARAVVTKTGKKVKVIPTKELLRTATSRKYQELINEEIRKRKAFKLEEVRDELQNLSREWKPFDPSADPEFTKYRYSSPELYADAISALINAPGLVRAKAPLFYEGFFNYLEKKPEVKSLYYEIQDMIKSGDVEKHRTEGIYEMFRKGDDAYALSLEKDVKLSDLIKRDFITIDHFVLKKVKQIGEKEIPAGENPRYKLEDLRYTASEIEWYAVDVLRNTVKPLENQNLGWDDFGFELFLRRVAGERAKMANPKGWTPELAKKKLAELKKIRSPEQNKAMDTAVKNFRDTHMYIVEKGEEAGRWADDLVKVMKDTEEYATFDVIKYIEKRHGAGPAAKIYQQIGTLEEVSNPATALILKDVAIIKATNRGIAAEAVCDFMQKRFPKEIRPAETRWNGRFHEIKEPDPRSREGLIVYLKEGKAQGFYVNKYIAETFESNPIEAQVLSRILSATAQPFRTLFIDVNPGFWLFNLWRDYWRAVKMLSGTSFAKFAPHYLKGIKPAFKSVFGIPTEVTTEMLQGNELVSMADFRGRQSLDKTVEKLLQKTHILPTRWNNSLMKPFGGFFNFYTNIGRAFERIPKVAGHTYLKQKFPEMPAEVRASLVRERAGSPAFLIRGRLYPIYNNFLLFSNAMKEGYRGDYRAFADNPAEFMWKQAKYTYLPKLLMFAGAIGMLGSFAKAIFDGMSEYDKANYMDIPLGLTEGGKSVYLRVPTDETGRFMGGILWKVLNHQKIGWGDVAVGLFDYMAGQAPTIHPGIDILMDIVQYCSGLNPYDAFYGRFAIPEDVRKAGGMRSHKAFLRYLADKGGANVVYRFRGDRVEEIKGELEEVLGWPFVSNIVGRFLKVSDYGIVQQLRRAKEEARKENTRALLDAKDAVIKLANHEELIPRLKEAKTAKEKADIIEQFELTQKDIEALLAKPDIIERNLIVNLARRHGLVYLDEFLRAGTNAEKAAVLKVLLEKERLLPSKPQRKPLMPARR